MSHELLRPSALFDLSEASTARFFDGCEYVWEALPRIKQHTERLTAGGSRVEGTVMPGAWLSDRPIVIEAGAIVEPGAYIMGPAYIGAGAVIRHGAYVRENVILLAGAMLGHASEAKNSLFLPHAAAPHFAYVGDSILGQRVNLGAGTKLSNLGILSEKDKASGKRPTIRFQIEDQAYDTGLTKFGAILGDDVQTGCNSVLNPGCIVGPRTLIYANLSLRKGYHPADAIIKLRQNVRAIDKEKRTIDGDQQP
jgi:UDP-N-acetylglucosamine diphosphorylase / glucose-1-phosphate thymidylyltransferase / UDP-N-acetylgalactosamine diphosphorylase / glucosamine-1-phosphate N-acetyltransferase / galactosamine-1-phosphate N-acetyltransferase